ncbi:MAG: DUF4124 domain-containing protein [Gammaproteobacteria bacterium]
MKLTLAALLGMLVIGSPCFAGANVYKWVDDKGEVNYSDRQHPGAEEMKNLDVPIYVSPPPPLPALAKSEPQPQTAKVYESVAITRPENDQGIRSNNGDVSVSVAVLPELHTDLGHRLGVLLDGALIGEPSKSTEIQLNNIERGSHTVQAVVFEAGGNAVAESPPITIHLHRQSLQRPDGFNSAPNFPAPNFPAPNYPFKGPGVTPQ